MTVLCEVGDTHVRPLLAKGCVGKEGTVKSKMTPQECVRGACHCKELWCAGRCQQWLPKRDVRARVDRGVGILHAEWVISMEADCLFLVTEELVKAQKFNAVFYPGWGKTVKSPKNCWRLPTQGSELSLCNILHGSQASSSTLGLVISLSLVNVYKFVTIFLGANWN